MNDELKKEQAEVRAGILELMADEDDQLLKLREAYENLPRDAWVNQVIQNVVKHAGYDRLEPVEAASLLALTTEIAELVKKRLMQRFDMVVCASSSVFPYVDTAGEDKAVACDTHMFSVPTRSTKAIADTLVTLVRLTAKDEHDTLFIHSLITPIKGLRISKFSNSQEEAAMNPMFQTRFASVRRKA